MMYIPVANFGTHPLNNHTKKNWIFLGPSEFRDQVSPLDKKSCKNPEKKKIAYLHSEFQRCLQWLHTYLVS